MEIPTIDLSNYRRIVFFTGAGMSAESGVPTYRGKGGIWNKYDWEEYASQAAFDADPEKVLEFHQVRRQAVYSCRPHKGYYAIVNLEKKGFKIAVVTQNIDGMHQRAGSKRVIELHGSLWRLRCDRCAIKIEDTGETYHSMTCKCGNHLRPDIVWFGDILDAEVVEEARQEISNCDIFISVGTSGVVWPAAGFPQLAKSSGARCVEINPEPTEMSYLYDEVIRGKAGKVLPLL